MRKGDYGASGGHPLSVRRIRAVTDAIKALAGEDEDAAATMGQYRFGEGVKVSVSCTAVLNGGELEFENEF